MITPQHPVPRKLLDQPDPSLKNPPAHNPQGPSMETRGAVESVRTGHQPDVPDLMTPGSAQIQERRLAVLMREANFKVVVLQDGTPVRGNAGNTGNSAVDKIYEDGILNRLRQNDIWAWACVQVTAIYGYLKGESSGLGRCCYKDEGDFIQSATKHMDLHSGQFTFDSRYDELRHEAAEDVLSKLEAEAPELLAELDDLPTPAHLDPTMQGVKAAFIDGLARSAWSLAWARAMEEKGASFSQKRIDLEAPPTPLSVTTWAREQAELLRQANRDARGYVPTIEDLVARAIQAEHQDVKERRELRKALNADIKEMLERQAKATLALLEDPCEVASQLGFATTGPILGEGFRWEDSHARFGLRVHHAEGPEVCAEDLDAHGVYAPLSHSMSEMHYGTYLTLQVVHDHTLEMRATSAFLEKANAFARKATCDVWDILLEDHCANGWEQVEPYEVGALTDAPLIAMGALRDDGGHLRFRRGARVFGHMNYQVEDPVKTLREGGVVIWMSEAASPFSSKWYSREEVIQGIKRDLGRRMDEAPGWPRFAIHCGKMVVGAGDKQRFEYADWDLDDPKSQDWYSAQDWLLNHAEPLQGPSQEWGLRLRHSESHATQDLIRRTHSTDKLWNALSAERVEETVRELEGRFCEMDRTEQGKWFEANKEAVIERAIERCRDAFTPEQLQEWEMSLSGALESWLQGEVFQTTVDARRAYEAAG